jgi:hypothetical protein
MPLSLFDESPFNARPELSPYLIHLTKTLKQDNYSAFDNLVSILKGGKIIGNDSPKGFIEDRALLHESLKCLCFQALTKNDQKR